MPAPLSIVIPTLNAAESLPRCLEALMEGLEAGLIRELIVSDGGSTDATGAVAQAWGADVLHGPASRGGQLRRGCALAQGDWILVLHADTCLAPGWAEVVRRHLNESNDAAWFPLAFDRGGLPAWLVAGWANLRSRAGLPYGDQGLLLPRALYERVGGYAEMPLMEDVNLARRLKGRLVRLDGRAITSGAKYATQGWFSRGRRNLWTLARYAAGADVKDLASRYRQ
ncbi:MAG: TIGR04283 family arsenosugar biosynthesis glycosyltransferase [Sulfitobacter sp.]|nr:TIGR04283 family arsenosugar biosynthesis glycosyltransferase [Sulfitobacter sp.]